jgi:hypothetical protein
MSGILQILSEGRRIIEAITYNPKVYKTMRENGGWDNYSMIEIEKYPCKDANEACVREREWFEILHSNLNTSFPQRGREEYRHVNKKN